MMPIRARFALLGLIFVLGGTGAAHAQCGPLPYDLTNGQVADALTGDGKLRGSSGLHQYRRHVEPGLAGEVGVYEDAGSVISGSPLSDVLDNAAGSAQGSIMYRGASEWEALNPGTSGYFLQSGGPGANPAWAPTGGGSGGISTIVGAGIPAGTPTVALPQYPVVSRPPLSAFTWINQASATSTEYVNGPLVITTNQVTGANGLNALVKQPLGADWTATFHYAQGNRVADSNLDMIGVAVSNSLSGRIYAFGLSGANQVAIWAYSSPTSWASSPGLKNVLRNFSSVWLRVRYVSLTTSLSFLYSVDGFTWQVVYTTNAPYVGVPDRYGITVGSQGNSAGSILSLDYMSESSP